MAIFQSSHSVTTLSSLPSNVTLEQALAMLHDHSAMISLNPVAIKHTLLAPSTAGTFDKSEGVAPTAAVYEVVDDLTIDATNPKAEKKEAGMGWATKFFPQTVSYKIAFANTANGMQSDVFAPLGFRSTMVWKLRNGQKNGENVVLIEEVATIRANWAIIQAAKGSTKEGQETMVKSYVAAVVARA